MKKLFKSVLLNNGLYFIIPNNTKEQKSKLMILISVEYFNE